MSHEIAVSAHGLSKTFRNGEVVALDGFDLEVPRGQVVGLLGPNGSGKTTAVRILSTILRPDAGVASILGFDVAKDAAKVRRVIGLAGQYATVDENLTGAENLTMVGRLCHLSKPEVRRRMTELLEQFGLSDAGGRPVKTYSGGMRRRLDLAASLVTAPPVLFLDEPTTGLDPQSRLALWDVIDALVESGTTVLLTTQYLEEADRLARDIVVIDHGRVIAKGTPAELKADLGSTVLELTLESPESASSAASLFADLSTKPPHVDGPTVGLTVDAGPSVAAEALRRIDAAGFDLIGLNLHEPSLDDVFLALTGRKAEVDPDAIAQTSGRKSRRTKESA
ncbi:MAG: ATP-binding cassette domain-containing protein [Actinomycetes bacterium]